MSNEDFDAISASTLAVMQRHAEASASGDAKRIAADYAEDAVILISFIDHPLVGRAAIEEWAANSFQAETEGLRDDAGEAHPEFKTFTSHGEYGYLVVELPTGAKGTETYHIRNDEILFETATFFM
ncbi:hypothetical protein ACPPVQ_02210 [Diaminobutyricibacter sp. McL0618]|uniref:hypothetical protein n=1 Tax=Leifsonia sp. McL0618 TaxID=3415677 RepID=UPI003CE6C837